jgi:hypothetical protein
MRAFAQKGKPLQGEGLSLRLQRPISDRALQRTLQADDGKREAESSAATSSRFAHDFSRVPVRSAQVSHTGGMVAQRVPAAKASSYEDCTDATTFVRNPRGILAVSLDSAQRFVNGAICVLDTDPATLPKGNSYKVAAERHFLNPSKAQRAGLNSNFQAILGKLKPEDIRCVSTSADQDYCFSNPEAGAMSAFMRDKQTFLCASFWLLNNKCRAITLIHEAVHAIALGMGGKHPPYRGSAEYPFGAKEAGAGETAALRTDNPDAYGYFAAHVWRDVDTECGIPLEVIKVTGSAPASSGESKEGK